NILSGGRAAGEENESQRVQRGQSLPHPPYHLYFSVAVTVRPAPTKQA
ncbi:MAG: hypothetical protein H6Q99_773, partial [Proteobacteria bacterium]|nr:hypothetical protein [Pseudomonadota bacterium]